MKTVNLVRASAEIITVISLKKGDVYKRLEKNYSGYSVHFGVVTDVLHNGEQAAITSLEYASEYNSTSLAKVKVFGTEDDIQVFYATPEEFRTHLGDLERDYASKIKKAKKELVEMEEVMSKVQQLKTDNELRELNSPETKSGLVVGEIEGDLTETP